MQTQNTLPLTPAPSHPLAKSRSQMLRHARYWIVTARMYRDLDGDGTWYRLALDRVSFYRALARIFGQLRALS